MRLLRCMAVVLALVMAVGIGIYICTDSKEAEKIEEAVLI